MSKVKDKLFATLRDKPRVITKAAFWKIPHNTKEDEVALKIGRYNKPKDWDDEISPEVLQPKSELTLDTEELTGLIDFLEKNYEPFKQGIKAFIPLTNPYERENAEQIKALFSLPDKKKIVEFLLSNDVIPEELSAGLLSAKRINSINQYESMLNGNLVEADWQKWFEENSWVLGSEFVRVLDERIIDTKNISDFLMEAYDGFLDIVEIKRPEGDMTFWAKSQDHGNYYPSTDLVKAITQASKYIYEVERESNSNKFLTQVDGVRTVKPRCILIFGRSVNWNPEQIEAFRILNSEYHNISILTYDHVLDRAKRVVGNHGC